MPRRSRTASPAAKWLAGVLIGALVIGTAALVYFALERVQNTGAVGTVEPAPTFTLGPPRTPSPTPTPSPSPEPTSSAWGADERYLAVGSSSIWRATAGDCGGVAPRLERSDDGGESWADVTPLYKGIGQVVALSAFAGTEAETIASMGEACETQALRTFTQGEFWESYPEVLAASRFLEPSDPAMVATPGGAVTAPCSAPQSFRASGDIVALVCNGTAQRLVNGTWAALPASDVSALAIDRDTVVTAGTTDDCDGLALIRWSGDALTDAEQLGCAIDVDPAAPLAIAVSGDRTLVWSGDALQTIG